jgi:TRAP-type C4-dicarboxylate transport system substrate-binding protein
MRLGSLQGAVLASPGLAEIDRAVYALSIPLAYTSDEEVYATLDCVRPGLEGAMAAKGFVPLAWADGGWLRIFARRPVTSPDDLRRQKLFQWAGDTPGLEIWKSLGFNAIPAPATELATGLQTGLLDAFLTSPQAALVTRYYEQAPHMTDLRWAIIMVATVVTKDAWNRVPADVRPALLKAAQDTALRLRADMRASDEQDLQAMRQAGLKTIPVDARGRDLWLKLLDGARSRIRGEFVPAQAYDEALRCRDARRRQRGGK